MRSIRLTCKLFFTMLAISLMSTNGVPSNFSASTDEIHGLGSRTILQAEAALEPLHYEAGVLIGDYFPIILVYCLVLALRQLGKVLNVSTDCAKHLTERNRCHANHRQVQRCHDCCHINQRNPGRK